MLLLGLLILLPLFLLLLLLFLDLSLSGAPTSCRPSLDLAPIEALKAAVISEVPVRTALSQSCCMVLMTP